MESVESRLRLINRGINIRKSSYSARHRLHRAVLPALWFAPTFHSPLIEESIPEPLTRNRKPEFRRSTLDASFRFVRASINVVSIFPRAQITVYLR